jgi:hypothetical protein
MLGYGDVVRVTAAPEIVGERNQGLMDFYKAIARRVNTTSPASTARSTTKRRSSAVSFQVEMKRRAAEFAGAEILPFALTV